MKLGRPLITAFTSLGLTSLVAGALAASSPGQDARVGLERVQSLSPLRPPPLDPPGESPPVIVAFPSPPDPGPRPRTQPWPADGTPICSAPGDQTELNAANDLHHGAYFAWRDRRSGGSDIYATRLGPDGEPRAGWPADGLPVCSLPGEQYSPRVISDLREGLWVTWLDERSGSPEVFVQRLRADGSTRPGWPADGRRIASGRSASAWSDLEGGIILLWHEVGSFPARNFRLHLLANDEPATGSPSDSGGLIYTNGYLSNGCSHVERYMSTVFPVWPDRMLISYEQWGTACVHGCGDCYSIYGGGFSFVDEAGNVETGGAWSDYLNSMGVINDGTGGWFLYHWVVKRLVREGNYGHIDWDRPSPLRVHGLHSNSGSGHFLQGVPWDSENPRILRLLDDGVNAPGWQDGGVPPCEECDPMSGITLAPDGFGGALLGWKEARPEGMGLYATRIRGDAVRGWSTDGRLTAPFPIDAIPPGLIGNGKGDAIAYWQDLRNGNADLWAYRISYDAPPPPSSKTTKHVLEAAAAAVPRLAFRFDGAAPNPSDAELAVRFQLPRSGRADVTIIDIAGRTVLRRTLDDLAAGPHHLKIAGPGVLAPGVYVVRLEFGGAALTRRVVMIP